MYYLNLSADADEFKAARRRLRSDLLWKRLVGRPSQRPLIEQSASAAKYRRWNYPRRRKRAGRREEELSEKQRRVWWREKPV